MDCRWTLRLTALVLSCVAGCTSLPWSSTDKDKDKIAEWAKDAKKNQTVWQEQTKLKPETLVAYGRYKEQAAEEPTALESDRERLREQARTSYQRALTE